MFNRWCGDPKDAPKCLYRLTGANLTLISGGSVVATELIGDTCKLHEVELIFGAIPAVQKVKIRSTTGEQTQLFEVELLSADVTNVIKNNGDPDGSNATSSTNATFESPSSQMAMFNGTESHNTEATAAVVNSDFNNTIDIKNISTVARFRGSIAHRAPDFDRFFPARPKNITDLSAWTRNFKESIQFTMSKVKEVGS